MSTINVYDLRPTGSELFSDSESYMSELGENELASVNGGAFTTPVCVSIAVSAVRSSVRCARSAYRLSKAIYNQRSED